MLEVLEAPLPKRLPHSLPKALEAYKFKPGCKPGPGRSHGSKNRLNASDILKSREGRIARHYVSRAEKSDSVLIDAMSKLLPKSVAAPTVQTLIFVGEGRSPLLADGPLTVQIQSVESANPLLPAPNSL